MREFGLFKNSAETGGYQRGKGLWGWAKWVKGVNCMVMDGN